MLYRNLFMTFLRLLTSYILTSNSLYDQYDRNVGGNYAHTLGKFDCGSRPVHGDMWPSKERFHHLSANGCPFSNTLGRECASLLPDCWDRGHCLRSTGRSWYIQQRLKLYNQRIKIDSLIARDLSAALCVKNYGVPYDTNL